MEVRKHGVSKRRTWRKLHIGIDVNTQEIISVSLTGNDEDDAAIAQKMIEGKTKQIKSFRGDGASDDFSLREKLGTIANYLAHQVIIHRNKENYQIINQQIEAGIHPEN